MSRLILATFSEAWDLGRFQTAEVPSRSLRVVGISDSLQITVISY